MTEHNRLNAPALIEEVQAEFAGQIILIQGMEWTTDRIHINFIDLHHWDTEIPAETGTDEKDSSCD